MASSEWESALAIRYALFALFYGFIAPCALV